MAPLQQLEGGVHLRNLPRDQQGHSVATKEEGITFMNCIFRVNADQVCLKSSFYNHYLIKLLYNVTYVHMCFSGAEKATRQC